MPTQHKGYVQNGISSTADRRKFLKATGGVGIVSLAGCLGGDDGIELTIVSQDTQDPVVQANEEAGDAFEEETGHEVTFEYAPGGEIIDRIASMIRGGNPPDAAIGANDVTGVLLGDDQLRPVTEFTENIEDLIGEYSEDLTPRTDEGEVAAVPFYLHLWMNVVHARKLVEAGVISEEEELIDDIDLRYNLDWDTFQEWVSAIDEETDVPGGAYPYSSSTISSQQGMERLYANGVHFWDGSVAEGTLDVVLDQDPYRERAIETLDWWVSNVFPHCVDGADLTWADVNTGLADGLFGLAGYTTGSVAAAIEGGAGQEEWLDQIVGFNHPRGPNTRDDGNMMPIMSTNWNFMAESEHPDVTEDFVEFYLTSEHAMTYWHARPLHNLPPTAQILDSDEYLDNWFIERRPDELEFALRWMEGGEIFEPQLAYDGFNIAHTRQFNAITLGELHQKVILEEMDYGQAVDEAADEMRGFL